MEEKFVNNLVKKVKYAGFGDSKDLEIRSRIANNEPSFDVHFQPDFKHKTEAVVHIKKCDTKDDYYFNTYEIMVNKEGKEPLKQTIYTENPQLDNNGKWVNSTITLKEAYNMMDMDDKGYGRSVLKDFVDKEGVRSQSWVRFDFTRKNDSGNYPMLKTPHFDLDSKLEQSNIKGMDDPITREKLRERLEKGNETNVREVYNDAEMVKGIVVNPQFKNFKFVPASSGNLANEQNKGQQASASQDAAQDASQSQAKNEDKGASQSASDDASQGQQKSEGNSASQATANNAAQDQKSSNSTARENGRNNMRQAANRSRGKRKGVTH